MLICYIFILNAAFLKFFFEKTNIDKYIKKVACISSTTSNYATEEITKKVYESKIQYIKKAVQAFINCHIYSLTKMLLTRATSKAVGTTLNTKADRTKLIPLKKTNN